MEHPFLFLVDLMPKGSAIYEFTHHYAPLVYAWVAFILLVVVAKLAVGAVRPLPSGGQNFFEVVVGGLEDFMVDVMGEEGRPHFPLIATLFLYILTMNWMGLFPGMLSPTSNINIPASMAVVVIGWVIFIGFKHHGLKFFGHFAGPVWWLAPLIFPIELIGFFARLLSLTLRLFGNIMGEDMVLLILFALVGQFFLPVPMMVLALFTSTLQAFVFTLLTMLYLAGAIEEAHH